MKTRNVFRDLTIVVLLFASFACSLFGSQPGATEPVPSVEPDLHTETASSLHVTAITTGVVHACALLNNGKVKCWGSNDSGQLGDGTDQDRNAPIEVPNLSDVAAISAGGGHTCALTNTGAAICWGQNTSGQLGDGTNDKRLAPVSVSGLTDIVSLSAGADHTCAITTSGEAKCWGKNLYGRVGDGSNTRIIPSPVTVAGLDAGVIAISPGNEHTCAITKGGSVKCWGNNGFGQIGNDTTRNKNSPTDVTGLTNGIRAIAAGSSTSCAVTESNSTSCWGWIGLQDYYLSPHPVDGLERDIAAISVGADHICGLTLAGVVKCLGENEHGQLGNGATSAVYSAQDVRGLGSVRSIAASFYYTCALLGTGEVFCWGDNSSGQLGNGTNASSSEPVQVIGLME